MGYVGVCGFQACAAPIATGAAAPTGEKKIPAGGKLAPSILGAILPPAGIFFAVIGAAAGIASLIPGGDKAAAVFDLINPTKIMTCAARWGFGNSGNPTGGTNGGSMLSTLNTVRKIAQ